MIMGKNCDTFSFNDCSFTVQKDRESCARIAIWKDIDLTNSFTLEISFLGSDFGKYECFHYNPKIFYLMGEGFL